MILLVAATEPQHDSMLGLSAGLTWADIDKTWHFILATWCELKELFFPNIFFRSIKKKYSNATT